MADDVTLLPCKCGAEPTLVHMGYYCYRVCCEACGEASTIQATAAIARKKWNKERMAEMNAVALAERDARIAALEAELAKSRAWRATLADTGDELLAELRDAQEALSTSGIGGIYDTFQDVGDAIRQMAAYIKERDARIAELEAKLAVGREGTCETCAHAHEYEGALSCGLTESGRAIAHMMDCSYWEPKEDA